MPRILAALCLALLLSGCLHTAYDVVTLPVRAGAKVVDWSTTSQSEADRNAGRKMRKQQAREDKEARKAAKRERREQRDPN
ncbi:MAG: hypothetical protein JWO65_1491 [Sphingomonas bacterium]|nr:hypothetical protein [Sphingomonas bacterium]